MDENNYYKCVVLTQIEDAKGRLKNRKENYIVSAVSPTDVEVKMAKHLQMSDYSIVGINILNIVEIVK